MKEEVGGVILSTVSFMTALLVILFGSGNATLSDSRQIADAVQATLWAMPTPVRIEAPLVIEVTRIVQATPLPALPQTMTMPTTPTLAMTPVALITPILPGVPQREPTSLPLLEEQSAYKNKDTLSAAAVPQNNACPTVSARQYTLIPMETQDMSHPPEQHGDLNLKLRGYQAVNEDKHYAIYSGEVDPKAPLLHGIFGDGRRPLISQVYQVRGWDWACNAHGCADDWLTEYPVTLMGAAVAPGEELHIPRRAPEIYGGGYIAAVLYAEESRLTLAYTRDGSVANGYAVHYEEICVDPNLLALYHTGNSGGRRELPGLRLGDVVGVAASEELKIAIRDRGAFMDPRSELDWWHNQ